MATSNIKLFDENKSNMMSDAEYSSSTQRASGVQTGVASSQLQNKFQYQMSLMAYALAQLMLANGKNAMDSSEVSTFVANLSNSVVQKVLDKATDSEAKAGNSTTKWITPKQLVSVATDLANSISTQIATNIATQKASEAQSAAIQAATEIATQKASEAQSAATEAGIAAANTKIPKLTSGAGNFATIRSDGTLRDSTKNASSFAVNRHYPVVESWDGSVLKLTSWW